MTEKNMKKREGGRRKDVAEFKHKRTYLWREKRIKSQNTELYWFLVDKQAVVPDNMTPLEDEEWLST